VQPTVRKSELTLVNEQAASAFPRDKVLDLIERDDDVPGGGLVEPQRQERRRQLSRNGDDAARQACARVGGAGSRATMRGPYRSPMLAPWASSA